MKLYLVEIMGRSDHGSAVFDDKVWVIAGDIEGAWLY